LLVSVTDLVRRLGTRRPVQRGVRLEGLAITTAAVSPEDDVVVDLELESISNGVAVTGTVTVPWTGPCRRCLEPVRGSTTADVQEIFARNPLDDEMYPLSGDLIDLEPLVRDTALLALPLAPLCTAGCLGPEPAVFPTLVEGEDTEPDAGAAADGDEAPTDPRWAALDQLKFD
jgi:uncharacterized protein